MKVRHDGLQHVGIGEPSYEKRSCYLSLPPLSPGEVSSFSLIKKSVKVVKIVGEGERWGQEKTAKLHLITHFLTE